MFFKHLHQNTFIPVTRLQNSLLLIKKRKSNKEKEIRAKKQTLKFY